MTQVGKNNFRPPPKVDSSVVRIEPKNPLPPVNFKEWDGLGRLCFGRKNKTLGAIFKQKQVLALLEKNFQTYQALQSGAAAGEVASTSNLEDMATDYEMDIDDGDEENVRDEGGDMECDDGGNTSFKAKVLSVLSENGFTEKRSSKLGQDDFLLLLAQFNKAGIHFT